MINIEKFINSLKVAWVRKIVHTVEKTWHKLLPRFYRDIIYIQHFRPHFFKTAKATHENRFCSEVLKAYHEYSLHFQVRSNGEFLASPIMYNGNILINNEVIIRNKIFNVNCVMKENSEFLKLREFSYKFNLRLDFLTYHGLIRVIGRHKNSLGVLTNSVRTENNPPMHALLANKSGSSCIYQRILDKPEKPKGNKRWENKLYNIHPWPSFFKQLKKCSGDRKLLWLKFRIIHHILTTNRSVSKFKPNQCELCTFCNSNSETIGHVMWQYRYVQTFFNDLTNLLREKCVHLTNFKFSAMLVIFGVEHNIVTDGVMDLVVLLAKAHIYRSKTIQIVPTLSSFKYILCSRYLIDKKHVCYQQSR